MYDEQYQKECCANCKYRQYDTFYDEMWCGHQPPPEGLMERKLVGINGICEYFEEE